MTGFDEAMRLSKEAMKAQDGKKVPVTLEPDGPVIGEATLKYEPDVGLVGNFKVEDETVAEFLAQKTMPDEGI